MSRSALNCALNDSPALAEHTGSWPVEVSIVTPMHNEELCVREFHRRIGAALTGLGASYEIVLVNDGSTDATPGIIRELASADPHLVGVFLARNRGQCTAIYAGIQHSQGRYVVIMDGDLQHPPEEVPGLIEKIREGFELVKGVRKKRQESLLLRRIPSLIANYLMRATSKCDVHDMGGLSCIDGDLARSLKLREGQHRLIPALVYGLGGAVCEVPTSAPPIISPSTSGGSVIAPMVLITPSTAATIPRAGRASARDCSACAGIRASWWCFSSCFSM